MKQRPPDRIALLRYGRRRVRPIAILAWLLTLSGLVAIPVASAFGSPWIAVLALATALGGLWLNLRAIRERRFDQLVADDLRSDAIIEEFQGEYPLRYSFAYGMPLALTLVFGASCWVAWRNDFAPPLVMIAASLIPFVVALWFVAIRWREVAVRFTDKGIELRGRLIPWSSVKSIRPDVPFVSNEFSFGGRRAQAKPRIAFILTDPLTDEELPRGGFWHYGRGATEQELRISLAHTVETPGVIYQLAVELLRRSAQRQLPAPPGQRTSITTLPRAWPSSR